MTRQFLGLLAGKDWYGETDKMADIIVSELPCFWFGVSFGLSFSTSPSAASVAALGETFAQIIWWIATGLSTLKVTSPNSLQERVVSPVK